MVSADFRPEAEFMQFLRMRSENVHKTRLYCCQIATVLSPSQEIIVAEHEGDGSFQTGSRIYAISAHVH